MVSSITYNLAQSQNITETFKEFGNRLKGFIRNRVKNAHDAEDVFQDVFYQLAEAERLMKPIEHMSAWLYTVARNRINDLYRKKKPKPISEYLSDDEDEGKKKKSEFTHIDYFSRFFSKTFLNLNATFSVLPDHVEYIIKLFFAICSSPFIILSASLLISKRSYYTIFFLSIVL